MNTPAAAQGAPAPLEVWCPPCDDWRPLTSPASPAWTAESACGHITLRRQDPRNPAAAL